MARDNALFRVMNAAESLYILSDIHANLPALLAVLEIIPKEATIICAGDIVGYYIEPNEVCEALRARNVICIRGNHDMYATGMLPYDARRDENYRVSWTRAALSHENAQWLSGLPESLRLEVDHEQRNAANDTPSLRKVVVHHGSFDNVESYVYPDTPLDPALIGENALAVLGHTHHPMIRNYGTSYLLNPGSVGQPRDRNPAASFAVVDFRRKTFVLGRVEYDVYRYQKKLEQYKVALPMIEILSRCSTFTF